MSSNTSDASPRISVIPYTPTSTGWPSVHPRPLRPIGLHPRLDAVQTPALPSHRPSIFHTTARSVYRLSTHLVPAVYPRLVPDFPLPVVPAYAAGGTPSERRDKVNALAKEVQETQDLWEDGKIEGKLSEKLLWNCINRYVRTSARPGTTAGGRITLFLAHANGLHKETWETMLRYLLDAPAGEMVDEVWAWEAVQHGDAALVNAEHQNGLYDWLDDARDMAQFLMHYLPENVEETALPTRLERVSASVAKAREVHGYRKRKLVVVGHSFGGCTSLRVAIDFPRLFSGFVLVDPVLHKPRIRRPLHLHPLVFGALTRRDCWSSREEALRLFKKSPFFNTWHPEVLRDYVDYALTDAPARGVTLKISGLQEAISFANYMTSYETWELLGQLDETIALRWVVPEKPPLTTEEATYERVWRRPANSTNAVFHFAGHLIVQEAPLELAHDIAEFLLRRIGSTRAHL